MMSLPKSCQLPQYIIGLSTHASSLENLEAQLHSFVGEALRGQGDATGKRLLFVNAAVFNLYYQQACRFDEAANPKKDPRGGQSVIGLEIIFSAQNETIKETKAENAKLPEDNEAIRRKKQTAAARKMVLYNRANRKLAFWRILGPLINLLLAQAGPGTKYTRTHIQAAFEKELEKHQELKPTVTVALRTKRKIAENKPFDLAGWAMKLIREQLGEYVQRRAGRPS